MLSSSLQSICVAKPACVDRLPMRSPSISFRTRKTSVLLTQRIQFIVLIVGTILLSIGEASSRHTRRHRARAFLIESDPLSVLEGKGGGEPKGGKGGGKESKGSFFDVETSERWNESGDYFSLAPITVEGRLSEPPALSPALEFLAPTGSPSTSMSDAPSLSPTKSSSDTPSLGPSISLIDTSPRLSLAPSSLQVLPGATTLPPTQSTPSQLVSPTSVGVITSTASPSSTPSIQTSIQTASPTSRPSVHTGNGETGGDTKPGDGLGWNATSDSTVMCPGFTPDRLEVVTWKYSVTMDKKKVHSKRCRWSSSIA